MNWGLRGNSTYGRSSEDLLHTQMGDKFLGDVHPAQQLLQEAKSKPFLNGRRVQLHVLKASARTERSQPRGRPTLSPNLSSSLSASLGPASAGFCSTAYTPQVAGRSLAPPPLSTPHLLGLLPTPVPVSSPGPAP